MQNKNSRLKIILLLFMAIPLLLAASLLNAQTKGETKMTTEKWTALILNQNHMNMLECYDYHIYLENKQMLYSCTFHGNASIADRNGLCKLQDMPVTEADLAELNDFLQKLPLERPTPKRPRNPHMPAYDAATFSFLVYFGTYVDRYSLTAKLSAEQKDKLRQILHRLFVKVKDRKNDNPAKDVEQR